MVRRRIPIEKIENSERRSVTFTKRRQGLFSKSSTLCKLCDAQIAMVVFSANGKCFEFGHPSPEAVIERYCKGEETQHNFWYEDVDISQLNSLELQEFEGNLKNLKQSVLRRLETTSNINGNGVDTTSVCNTEIGSSSAMIPASTIYDDVMYNFDSSAAIANNLDLAKTNDVCGDFDSSLRVLEDELPEFIFGDDVFGGDFVRMPTAIVSDDYSYKENGSSWCVMENMIPQLCTDDGKTNPIVETMGNDDPVTSINNSNSIDDCVSTLDSKEAFNRYLYPYWCNNERDYKNGDYNSTLNREEDDQYLLPYMCNDEGDDEMTALLNDMLVDNTQSGEYFLG
ncbi:hypothetical protein IFM89_024416 [Coptis chinensis]|uniref:MADS-box domain-containing protein n=1 Tax=Coptis chinensis TaxID=261450 RepID=A0A835HPR8_9MAGN|nr:hypothetical protein IFM89_024416 [Coptis chinensis]